MSQGENQEVNVRKMVTAKQSVKYVQVTFKNKMFIKNNHCLLQYHCQTSNAKIPATEKHLHKESGPEYSLKKLSSENNLKDECMTEDSHKCLNSNHLKRQDKLGTTRLQL